jgi:hypothetical protein
VVVVTVNEGWAIMTSFQPALHVFKCGLIKAVVAHEAVQRRVSLTFIVFECDTTQYALLRHHGGYDFLLCAFRWRGQYKHHHNLLMCRLPFGNSLLNTDHTDRKLEIETS